MFTFFFLSDTFPRKQIKVKGGRKKNTAKRKQKSQTDSDLVRRTAMPGL